MRDLLVEQKRYQGIVLLLEGAKLSVRKIRQITGLRLEDILSLQEKISLVRFLKLDLSHVLRASLTSDTPVEALIDLEIVSALWNDGDIDGAKRYLHTARQLRNAMKIKLEDIESLDSDSIGTVLKTVYETIRAYFN